MVEEIKRVLVYGMTYNRGGMESYIMNIYRNMDRSRLIFDFVIDFDKMAYEDEVLSCGSRVYKIPAKSRHPINHLLKFKKLLKQHQEYKIVYFNILNAGAAYSMIVPHLLRKSIYVHSHSRRADNMRLHKVFKSLLNHYADKKLACSLVSAEFMYRNADNALIVKNAINTYQYAFHHNIRKYMRKLLGIAEKKAVITVGRMAEEKNPFFLLDIFCALCNSDDSYILLYVGAGVLEQKVKNYAIKLGITEQVMFLGERNDIPELLNAADCFLLPSLYEGFGIVLLEAQVCGLRCFTSAKAVPAETNVNGLVHFIGLDKTPNEWADEIITKTKDTVDRAGYVDSLTGTGYEIKENIEELTRLFEEEQT